MEPFARFPPYLIFPGSRRMMACRCSLVFFSVLIFQVVIRLRSGGLLSLSIFIFFCFDPAVFDNSYVRVIIFLSALSTSRIT